MIKIEKSYKIFEDKCGDDDCLFIGIFDKPCSLAG